MKNFKLSIWVLFTLLGYGCTNVHENELGTYESPSVEDIATLELNEIEAKELLTDFISSNPQTKGLGDFEVAGCKSFYVALPETESDKALKVKPDSIRLYEFVTKTNESTGYAIVIGDERIQKVLIQVEKGSLSDTSFIIPLKNYYNSIPQFITNDLARYAVKAVDIPLKTKAANYPIVTATSCFVPTIWGQQYPENAACPTVCPEHGSSSCLATAELNGRCKAGCVPIAMAQIMAYHRKPSSYNWTTILASSSLVNSSPLAINQASTLIANLGSAVSVSYGCDGTGIPSSTLSPRVTNAFSAYGYTYSGLTNLYSPNMIQPIIQSIGNKRPVFMAGITSGGKGHAWVCDAYKTHDYGYGEVYEYLHMNWGWRGDSNGYYYMDTSLYFNTGQYNFNSGIQFIANIR